MEGMRAKGHEPFLAADPDSEILRRLGQKFPSVAVPMGRLAWLVTVVKLDQFCRRNGITTIDAHSSKAHDLGIGLVALDRQRKLVVHRRVDYPVGKPNAPFKYRSAMVAKYVAISRAIAKVLESAGIAPERIVTVRSAVEATPHGNINREKARKAIRNLLGLKPDTLLFGNTAALSDQKGYGYLMEACGLLRDQGLDFHCVIAGDGPLRDRLEAQRITLQLDHHVSFLGFIKEVPEFLAALDVFVMPSIDEGLGTAALDACHSGCAMIVSDVGGLPEIITHEQSGLLVPPRNPAALAAAMSRLAKDPALRERLALAATAHVQEEFSVGAMVDGNLNVYKEL
jgi:glycosyltransferase involved in cell wall biosynthesis